MQTAMYLFCVSSSRIPGAGPDDTKQGRWNLVLSLILPTNIVDRRMTEPRKSTVYDFSDLRLHPNGTRVYQKSTNLRPKLARSTVQVARSNWIATDAGGSAKVPLFRKRKRNNPEGEEKESEDGKVSASGPAGGEGSSVEVDDDVDKKGKRKSKRQDNRKAKRQKFLQTDDYLAGVSTSDVGRSSDANSSSLPPPSPVSFVFHGSGKRYLIL